VASPSPRSRWKSGKALQAVRDRLAVHHDAFEGQGAHGLGDRNELGGPIPAVFDKSKAAIGGLIDTFTPPECANYFAADVFTSACAAPPRAAASAI
jgi:hypothetical protein